MGDKPVPVFRRYTENHDECEWYKQLFYAVPGLSGIFLFIRLP